MVPIYLEFLINALLTLPYLLSQNCTISRQQLSSKVTRRTGGAHHNMVSWWAGTTFESRKIRKHHHACPTDPIEEQVVPFTARKPLVDCLRITETCELWRWFYEAAPSPHELWWAVVAISYTEYCIWGHLSWLDAYIWVVMGEACSGKKHTKKISMDGGWGGQCPIVPLSCFKNNKTLKQLLHRN